jgi:hypothetical protein
MKLFRLASTLVGFSLALVAAPARAEDPHADRVVTSGPDRSLLRSGVWTLGLSYAPALVVGITSSLPEDRYLLAPVAGPWLDLGMRDCDECSHESLNKILLVADGIVQGIGALEIAGAFLFWETRVESARVSTPSGGGFQLRLRPGRFAGAYGLEANGTF